MREGCERCGGRSSPDAVRLGPIATVAEGLLDGHFRRAVRLLAHHALIASDRKFRCRHGDQQTVWRRGVE